MITINRICSTSIIFEFKKFIHKICYETNDLRMLHFCININCVNLFSSSQNERGDMHRKATKLCISESEKSLSPSL